MILPCCYIFISVWVDLLYWVFVVLWNDFSEGTTATESDEDNERHDAAEEETDEDDNTFFDTRDFLSSSSFKSSGSDYRRSSFDTDDDDFYTNHCENGGDAAMKSVGFNYPYVRRRKKLPDPVEKEKGVSLWSMIKDNIGKDLTKVCLPVYFNEPISSLQKCFEDLEYSFLIDRAYEWGKRVSLDWHFVLFFFRLDTFQIEINYDKLIWGSCSYHFPPFS